MSIVAYSPYGLLSEETGLCALVSRYLQEKRGASQGEGVLQICCNGAFSQCDRDGESSWRRDLAHCARCTAEQIRVAQWAGISQQEVSRYLTPGDIVESRRWVGALAIDEIPDAGAFGESLYDLCRVSLVNRFGTEKPDLHNKSHEQIVRRMLLVALRALSAFNRYFRDHQPEFALLVGGEDVLTAAFLSCARAQSIPLATFVWDVNNRAVLIRRHGGYTKNAGQARSEGGDIFSCPFVFENITAMRSDRHTWPHELVTMLDRLLEFLELDGHQVPLPLAR